MKPIRSLFLLTLVLALPPAAHAQESKASPRLERIAFGSCANQHEPQPIWNAIVAAKPQLFLFIGDSMYADLVPADKGYRLTRNVTVDLIRQSYDKLAQVPGFQKLKKTCPILATWDDHDYGLNDAGTEFPLKKQSQKLFLDFFGEPADSPRRQQEGVYDAKLFGPPGQRVQVILLDTRFFRSPLKQAGKGGTYVPDDEPTKTILGEAQWKWLERQLREPAQLRLLCSSIQLVAEDQPFEKWMNLPRERARLFQLLKDTKANGVVVLSGDLHMAELSVIDAGLGYPLFDLTSSGLNQGFKSGWRKQLVNRHRVMTMNTGDNFGFIAIDWDAKTPTVSLQIRDVDGDVTIRQKLPLRVLQPAQKDKGPKLASGEELTPKVVKANLDKKVTVEMKVQSTGASGGAKLVFLNSEENYRNDGNFTVVLNEEAQTKFKKEDTKALRSLFDGQRIRVTGTLTLYRERPQIMVSDPGQIEVLKN